MFDTVEAGAGSYPEPPEEKTQTISGKITLTYDIESDVPSKWNKEDLINNIKENLNDYVYLKNYEDIDIDLGFWGEEDV